MYDNHKQKFTVAVVENEHECNSSLYLAGLHDQNKSGFFGGLAFIQPIRAI